MNDLALGVPAVAAVSQRTILDVIRSAAAALGVRCDSPGGDGHFVRLRRGDRVRFVHADDCGNERHVPVAIAHDVRLARAILLEAGIPVPDMMVAASVDDAMRAAMLWSGPVAVASIDADGRVGAMPRFDTPEDIRAAFMRAALVRGRAAIFGPLYGFDHRVLIVGGVAVAAVRCMQPRVTGNGVSPIRALIAAANESGDAKRRAAIP